MSRYKQAKLWTRCVLFYWFEPIAWLLTLSAGFATLAWGYYFFGDWVVVLTGVFVGTALTTVLYLVAAVSPQAVLPYYRYTRRALDICRSYRDNRGFFLYLRAYDDGAAATTIDNVVAPENEGRTTYTYYENFSDILSGALSGVGRVLFIGRKGMELFDEYGLSIISSADDWWATFQRCAAQARAIFVVPEASPGLINEMHYLFTSELKDKVILVMRKIDSSGERRRQWDHVRKNLNPLGFGLPSYDERGALAIIVDGRWMIAPFDAKYPEKWEIKPALNVLFREQDAERFKGGQSLREILPDLKIHAPLNEKEAWVFEPDT
jgi:hypothetical protein